MSESGGGKTRREFLRDTAAFAAGAVGLGVGQAFKHGKEEKAKRASRRVEISGQVKQAEARKRVAAAAEAGRAEAEKKKELEELVRTDLIVQEAKDLLRRADSRLLRRVAPPEIKDEKELVKHFEKRMETTRQRIKRYLLTNKFNNNEMVKSRYLKPFFKYKEQMLCLMVKNCIEQGVPLWMALGVAFKESVMNPNRINRRSGATGLMQVKPTTAGLIGVKGSMKKMDANIEAGVKYLRLTYQEFDGHWGLAAAAYNAGDIRLKEILKQVAPGINYRREEEKALVNPLFLRSIGSNKYDCLRYAVEVGVGAEFMLNDEVKRKGESVKLIEEGELVEIYEQYSEA